MHKKTLKKNDNNNHHRLIFEFLIKQSELLKDLFIHSRVATQNIFNYYITIFSASTGTLLVALQLKNNSIPLVVYLLFFLTFIVVIGIIYQSCIINKYAEQAYYSNEIEKIFNRIQTLLSTSKSIQQFKILTDFQEFQYCSQEASRFYKKIINWEKKHWYFFSIGIFQLYITLITSLSLCLIPCVISIYIEIYTILTLKGVLTLFLSFLLLMFSQFSYAHIIIKNKLSDNNIIDKKPNFKHYKK